MKKILNMLIKGEDNLDNYIETPDVHNLTYEDSGDKKLYGNRNANKLTRKQLMLLQSAPSK